jgi:hypothetical protein
MKPPGCSCLIRPPFTCISDALPRYSRVSVRPQPLRHPWWPGSPGGWPGCFSTDAVILLRASDSGPKRAEGNVHAFGLVSARACG